MKPTRKNSKFLTVSIILLAITGFEVGIADIMVRFQKTAFLVKLSDIKSNFLVVLGLDQFLHQEKAGDSGDTAYSQLTGIRTDE
jgi:hypothetical protein